MGLDMYLRTKRFLSEYRELDKEIVEHLKKIPGLVPEGAAPKELQCEAMYWRKANHIHKWFVDNVQGGADDCGNYYVGRDQLQELVDLCKEVIADNSKAATLLPTQAGFFFGGTLYDEWYFGDLQSTVDGLEKALSLFDEEWDFEYHSSW